MRNSTYDNANVIHILRSKDRQVIPAVAAS